MADHWILVFAPERAQAQKKIKKIHVLSMCLCNLFSPKLVMVPTQIPLRKEAFTEGKSYYG